MKVLRRSPAPDPGDRQQALARLRAAQITPVRRGAGPARVILPRASRVGPAGPAGAVGPVGAAGRLGPVGPGTGAVGAGGAVGVVGVVGPGTSAVGAGTNAVGAVELAGAVPVVAGTGAADAVEGEAAREETHGLPAAAIDGVRIDGVRIGEVVRDEVEIDEAGRDEVVRGGWVPDSMVPERLRGSRWGLAPRHVGVIAAVLVAGLGWAAWSLAEARPETVPDPPTPAGIVSGSPVAQPADRPTAGPSGSAASTTPAPTVVVHVAGKVRRPGLVHAKAGARIADVVAAAGGALPGVDLTSLNLARQVTDGEQILVGVPGVVPASTPSASTGPDGRPDGRPDGGGQVDLNAATAVQLEELPGVGPVLAQRIVDWRTEHRRFSSVDELQEVSGVGEKKFEELKPHVRVG